MQRSPQGIVTVADQADLEQMATADRLHLNSERKDQGKDELKSEAANIASGRHFPSATSTSLTTMVCLGQPYEAATAAYDRTPELADKPVRLLGSAAWASTSWTITSKVSARGWR
jgi:hypothetical protein